MKDSRYTISREFTGLSHPMYVLRFCGDMQGAYKYKKDAEAAKLQHILQRNEKLTGRKIETITAWRKPTPYEIKLGYGAPHYRDFDVMQWVTDNGHTFKGSIKADDGLRYYR